MPQIHVTHVFYRAYGSTIYQPEGNPIEEVTSDEIILGVPRVFKSSYERVIGAVECLGPSCEGDYLKHVWYNTEGESDPDEVRAISIPDPAEQNPLETLGEWQLLVGIPLFKGDMGDMGEGDLKYREKVEQAYGILRGF